MAVSVREKPDFGLPDLTFLSVSERIHLMSVMQKAKEFDMQEEAISKSRQPLEGQLKKFTNVMKGWQPRWFMLDPESGLLEYFEKEEHKKQRARGYLNLANSVISPSEEDSQTFLVNAANGEVFKLKALDAKERQQWVDRLRSASQHHAALITQSAPQVVKRELQSSSVILTSQNVTQKLHRSLTGSNENLPQTQVASQRPVVPIFEPPIAHPHIIDPFQEVREYMMEAEDYSHSLIDKINTLPHHGKPIGGLDADILLLKATSSATLQCLSQCLNMLQQRQEAFGVTDVGTLMSLTDIEISSLPPERCVRTSSACDSIPSCVRTIDACDSIPSCVRTIDACDSIPSCVRTIDACDSIPSCVRTIDACDSIPSCVRTIDACDSIPSTVGSFTSTSSLQLVLPPDDSHKEDSINHDDEVEDEAEYKDHDLKGVEEHKFIILHLLSQLKLGMDLTKVVLPTFILERRSLLELFADCMAHPDVFLRITDLPDPEDRMMAVLEWYLTSFHVGRQGSQAKKPYNPIIGETFHCSWRTGDNQNGANGDVGQEPCLMTYTAEQVSHHPPISAFYFECPKRKVCMNASIYTKSKFMGLSIGVIMVGKVVLKLLEFDEEYVFGLPSVYARSILTTPWAELGDKIQITCQKTQINAAVTFHTKPFYGGKLHKVTAEVKNGKTGNIICKVQGDWNNSLEFVYPNETTKLVDITKIPIWKKRVRPLHMQGEHESRQLWSHVSNALKVGDVNTATEHKEFLEECQREGERHRQDTKTEYLAKYFHKVGDSWIYKNILKVQTS